MKKRSRKVLRADRDYGSSRNSSVQPKSALEDSYSRVPTTAATQAALPRSVSSSPIRDLVDRQAESSGDQRFPGLETVFPRPGSPTGSVHFDCDPEMQTLLTETAQLIQSCPLPPLQKVPASYSEKALLGRQQSRGRQRMLPPVGSTAVLEISQNLSNGALHTRVNPNVSEDLNRSIDITGPRLKPMPRSIVEDYKDKRVPQVRQSRSSVRSLESKKAGMRLPHVGKKGRSRGSP